jgi:glycosyltransferase involved in cell wall biosynthesis
MLRRAFDIFRMLLQRRCDVIVKCINGPLILFAVYAAARIRRIPFVLWTGIWMRIDTPAHRRAWPLTRYLYRHSDALVVYGTHVRDYLISEGVSAERIFLAPNAVDNEVYSANIDADTQRAARSRCGVSNDQRIILFIGRLEDGKGLDYLIEAFHTVSTARHDAVLVIAGDGSLRAALEMRARDLGIADCVRFVGHVPVREAVHLYATAYAYILPSVTTPTFKEPWGLVVNEAFGQGLPVIATTSVGAAAGGMLRHGENGIVVPERNSDALAEAMLRLLGDTSLHQRMAASARATIDTWTQEGMVQGFDDAVRYVLTQRQQD